MIKSKYTMGISAALAASAVLLGGCGGSIDSAEDLFSAMNDKIADTKSFDADVSLVLDMDYVLYGSSDNMRLDFKEKITAVLDANEVYIDGSMSVTDVYDEAWQTYLIEKDDGFVSYTCAGGEWYYDDVDADYLSEGPSSLTGVLSGIQNCSFEKDSDYVIEADVDSEIVINILNALYSNVIENAFSEGLDTSGITAKIILKADKDTCLPKSLELVFNDCSDMFTGEDMFDEAEINEFKLSVVFDNYNETDNIELPEDVAELFEFPEGDEESSYDDEPMTFDDSEDIESDAEGYYGLTDYGNGKTISLKEPEGFKFNSDSDASLISFDKTGKADGYCSAVYELSLISDSYTRTDVEGYIENICNFYGSDDDYSDIEYIGVKSIEISGRTINYSGMKYHYAGDEFTDEGYSIMYSYWTYIGDYVLVCNITDYTSDGFGEFNETEMAEVLFENIKE